jgi:hypothetical protein
MVTRVRHEYDMDDESKFPQPEQIASVTAPSKPLVVHALAVVPEYVLGALDFATPAVTSPVTPLQVQSYSLGSLGFSAPAWGIGIGCTRVTVDWDQGGRPEHIPDDVKAEMIPMVVAELSRLQVATPWKRLVQGDSAVKDFVRKLADEANIDTSDYTLKTQILRPAFKRWRAGQ